MLDRLPNRLAETAHVGLAGPVEGRQRACGVECVTPEIVQAFAPVDAAHILTPADDLADEALNCVQRRASGAILKFGAAAEVQRIEQTHIEAR